MKQKEQPLSETNPYMRDPKLRKKMILVAAAPNPPLIAAFSPKKNFLALPKRT